MNRSLFIAIACAWTESCSPHPKPLPPDPAPSGDEFNVMCSNLAAIGCDEGDASNCAEKARAVGTPPAPGQTPLTNVPVACLTSAKDKSAARACGFVKCP